MLLIYDATNKVFFLYFCMCCLWRSSAQIEELYLPKLMCPTTKKGVWLCHVANLLFQHKNQVLAFASSNWDSASLTG